MLSGVPHVRVETSGTAGRFPQGRRTGSRGGGHEILPGDGHMAARWRRRVRCCRQGRRCGAADPQSCGCGRSSRRCWSGAPAPTRHGHKGPDRLAELRSAAMGSPDRPAYRTLHRRLSAARCRRLLGSGPRSVRRSPPRLVTSCLDRRQRTKKKAGCWTRRRAFAQVRQGSNIQLLPYSLVTT